MAEGSQLLSLLGSLVFDMRKHKGTFWEKSDSGGLVHCPGGRKEAGFGAVVDSSLMEPILQCVFASFIA